MLPQESEFLGKIASEYGDVLNSMDRFHDAAVALVATDGFADKSPKWVDNAVLIASLALYVKACKQYRSIQILCERGMGSEADSLVRCLFETTVNLVFVLKPRVALKCNGKPVLVPDHTLRSTLRARLYLAYSALQNKKFFGKWSGTRGLRRIVAGCNSQAVNMWSEMESTIGPDWSQRLRMGRCAAGNHMTLSDLADSLGLSQMYAMLYSPGSQSVHATDPVRHATTSATPGAIRLEWWPSSPLKKSS